jgi:hypothetical protein
VVGDEAEAVREIPRAAVIATHNRPAELRRCVEAIAPQVDLIVIVDNASEPPVTGDTVGVLGPRIVPNQILYDAEQPPNLSRLWNLGLKQARWVMFHHNLLDEAVPRCDLAVLNDDAVPPPGWFDAVAGAMRSTGAMAGCNDPFDQMGPGQIRVHGPDGPPGLHCRIAGWAMMLRGEWPGARFDEAMRWNFSDDDLSYRARREGGLVHVGGVQVQNTLADTSTRGVLAEQAGHDRAAFVAKHGVQPW